MSQNQSRRQGQPQPQVVVDGEVERLNPSALAVMQRSAIEAQIDTARKYPRDLKRFQANAVAMATMSADVAEACLYSLPRRDQDGNEVHIVGPSVRLAEILATCYGNIHSAARIVEEGAEYITAQGACWDLEVNNKVEIDAARRITTRSGRRYGADMIQMTGNAVIAIAYRNAVFKVIPRAYIDIIFETVKTSAVGDEKTLSKRRQEVVARLGKLGVHPDRIFAKLKKKTIDEITRDDVAMLIGAGTSIKDGVLSIDEAFPPVVVVPAPEDEGKRVSAVPVAQPQAQGAPPSMASVFSGAPEAPPVHKVNESTGEAPRPQAAPTTPPPPEPELAEEDEAMRQRFGDAGTIEEVNLAANALVAAKDRIGKARYKVLYADYVAAKERVSAKT